VGAEWKRVEDGMPPDGRFVLAAVRGGSSRARSVVRAIHAGKFSLECHLDAEGGEYDEATDTYYCEPGWYECNAFEDVHWAVDGTVTHWMPLPEAPDAD